MSSNHNIMCKCLSAFVQDIFQVFIQKLFYYIIFCPIYACLLKLYVTIWAKFCQSKSKLSFFLINCIYKKLCTIWCYKYKFDLWSNICLYQFICIILKYNNLLRSWAAQVCDLGYMFFTFFKFFDRKRASRKLDKGSLFKD